VAEPQLLDADQLMKGNLPASAREARIDVPNPFA
jgi:hypothetical protein